MVTNSTSRFKEMLIPTQHIEMNSLRFSDLTSPPIQTILPQSKIRYSMILYWICNEYYFILVCYKGHLIQLFSANKRKQNCIQNRIELGNTSYLQDKESKITEI